MKRILVILLSVCLLTGMCVPSASAMYISAKGICGDNLTWSISSNHLTISGTGPMYDYSEENPAPWAGDRKLKYYDLESGITRIGDYAFASECDNAKSIVIPATVTEIGSKAFAFNECHVYYLGSSPAFADDAYEGSFGQSYFITGWEASDLQNYGGNIEWISRSIFLDSTASKKIFQLNEEIKPEHLVITALIEDKYKYTLPYTPKELTINDYDNSTCGIKTVKITADGYDLSYNYIVSDGQNHFDLLKVDYSPYMFYWEIMEYNNDRALPTVTAGPMTLTQNVDYSIDRHYGGYYIGTDAQVRVTGKGEYEGYETTYSQAILRKDISDATISVSDPLFWGYPCTPSFWVNGYDMKQDRDFIVLYENNINMGTATAYIIGINGYYGCVKKDFTIHNNNKTVTLYGYNCGPVTGPLTNTPLEEQITIAPGPITFHLPYYNTPYAYFELYQKKNNKLVLLDTYATDFPEQEDLYLTYDFSSVYSESTAEETEQFLLTASWISSAGNVISAAYTLLIPTKVDDATSMVINFLENDGDFRREYLQLYGLDGNLGHATWMTSDPTIATVDGGVVTLKRPGTVTITAQYGNMTASHFIEAPAWSLENYEFIHYDIEEEKLYITRDYILMDEGIDYSCSTSKGDAITEVTITGIGLSTGQLILHVDNQTGEILDHPHTFDSECDETCNRCDYTRQTEHTPAETWTKNQTHHWHACTACGAKTDEAEHVLSPEDSEVCTVCGTLYIPGDIDCNMLVNRDDVVQLLLHVSMPDAFPIEVDADFTGDDIVNRDDVVQLLLHVSMPDAFPLSA